MDFISNGRLTVGLGFGSRENDYKAVEIPFEHRGSRAVEQVQLMKRLWTEDNVTHKGRFYNVENLTVGPKPIQKPHPPIWTGGSAEVALKRAGTWANGFICGSSAIPDFPATWEKISGYAKAAGRDPNKINKAGLTFMAIDDDQNKAVKTVEDYVMRYYGRLRVDVANTSLVGAPSAIIDRIGAFLVERPRHPDHRPGRPGSKTTRSLRRKSLAEGQITIAAGDSFDPPDTLIQAVQKGPDARRAWTVIVSVKRDREDRRARPRYTNTNSSEAIERNEAGGPFSTACYRMILTAPCSLSASRSRTAFR